MLYTWPGALGRLKPQPEHASLAVGDDTPHRAQVIVSPARTGDQEAFFSGKNSIFFLKVRTFKNFSKNCTSTIFFEKFWPFVDQSARTRDREGFLLQTDGKMGWLQAVLAALLAGLCEACPNDRPDIVCVQGAGIDGEPLPASLAKETSTHCRSPAGVNELTLTVTADVRIRDLDLLLSIDHGDLSELKIVLEGPTGVRQTLIDYKTIRGSDLVQTILDDEATTSGLSWKMAGSTKLAQGRELTNAALSEALTQTTTFTQEQWDAFGIDDLRDYDYIQAGDRYYQPAHTADLSAASSLYTGRWKITDGLMSSWDGLNARGEWSLQVYDEVAMDGFGGCGYAFGCLNVS